MRRSYVEPWGTAAKAIGPDGLIRRCFRHRNVQQARLGRGNGRCSRPRISMGAGALPLLSQRAAPRRDRSCSPAGTAVPGRATGVARRRSGPSENLPEPANSPVPRAHGPPPAMPLARILLSGGCGCSRRSGNARSLPAARAGVPSGRPVPSRGCGMGEQCYSCYGEIIKNAARDGVGGD